jgi:hypothetical protein
MCTPALTQSGTSPGKAHEHLRRLQHRIETEERMDNEETGAVVYLLAAILRDPWLR